MYSNTLTRNVPLIHSQSRAVGQTHSLFIFSAYSLLCVLHNLNLIRQRPQKSLFESERIKQNAFLMLLHRIAFFCRFDVVVIHIFAFYTHFFYARAMHQICFTILPNRIDFDEYNTIVLFYFFVFFFIHIHFRLNYIIHLDRFGNFEWSFQFT